MAEPLLRACLQEGFAAADLYEEKCDFHLHRLFQGLPQAHAGSTDFLCLRAFWERGEPLGFSWSAPRLADVKKALSACKAAAPAGKNPNCTARLPLVAPAGSPKLADPAFGGESGQAFAEIREKSADALVSFPGLAAKAIAFTAQLKRVAVANSLGFSGRYRKTLYSLHFALLWRGHHLEIQETRIFLGQLNPERMIARAHNLLQSIAQTEETGSGAKFLVLSPEAATAMIREFSRHFKIGATTPKAHEWLGSSAVTLVDNPLLEGQPGSAPFDDEGTAGREKTIINKGVFVAPISDCQTAFSRGLASTGNGFREERSPFPAVQFSNLYLKPSPFSLTHLLRDAGRGILVSMAKLKEEHAGRGELFFSGYGFRFQGDEIGEPVHLFIKTTFHSFWGHVRAVSKELRFFHQRFAIGAPYVLVEGKTSPDGSFVL